jgi:hypothetical protein
MQHYIENLKNDFEIQILDSLVLVELKTESGSKDKIHEKRISGGVNRAAENLIKFRYKNPTFLAFSIVEELLPGKQG